MALNFLDLPREMVAEVVKHVDYNGLLSLRRTCSILKELADEESFKLKAIRRISYCDRNNPNYQEVEFTLTLYNSKPPLFLLCYEEKTKRWTNGRIQNFNFKLPRDEFSEFLMQFREILPHCPIDTLNYYSSAYCSVFESFLEGLTIAERCINTLCYFGDKGWEVAYSTMERLQINTAQKGVNSYIAYKDKDRLADTVDVLILSKDHWKPIDDPIGLAMEILSKKCNHLELECSWLSEEQVNEAIHKFPLLGKKIYFYAKLESGVPKKTFAVGSMNVELDIGNSTGEVEIWHDGMRRRDRS